VTHSGEREALLAAAREHLDRLDGTLLPEFVKVQDGFYDRRIVLDSPLVVGFVPEGSTAVPIGMVWHYEPCRIPRYRTEVRWVPSLLDRLETHE
jgi:hypothetical protein